jgi:hypothetical protein
MQASLALNGAYSLFLDNLFEMACDFSALYRRFDTFSLSQRLFSRWAEHVAKLEPGDEYKLVDDFAEITEGPRKEGTTNPALLREKHPAAVFYFLDAFKRFDAMSPDEIPKVTVEAMKKSRKTSTATSSTSSRATSARKRTKPPTTKRGTLRPKS